MSIAFLISTLFTLSYIPLGFCDSCKNPQVTSTSFTTQDATIVTNIAYISAFSVQCSAGKVTNLYAELNGNIIPVPVVDSNKYEIGWTEDTKTARTGDRVVRIFDEDSYSAIRKALRSGNDVSTVPSLFDVVINHPGAYDGPWLKGELLATFVTLVISYLAISYKSKMQS